VKNSRVFSKLILFVGTFSIGQAQDVPKAEWFLGYNYIRVNSATNVPAYSSNGGSSQIALNFSKYVSGVIDLGGYHNGVIGGYDIDNTIFSYLFGPRVSLRNHSRVTPYLNTLFGGVWMTASTAAVAAPASTSGPNARIAKSQNAFAMAAGGGLDVRVNKHLTFRPIAVDYFLTRLQNPASLADNNQHNLRYSAGINFTLGGEAPAPPLPSPKLKLCWDGSSVAPEGDCPRREMNLRLTASQTEICPDASVRVLLSGTIPESAMLQWTVNGQQISSGPELDFGGSGRDPGVYKVTAAANAPDFNPSTTEVSITVLPYRPPSGTMQISPLEIRAGDSATVTAKFTPGQCGGELTRPDISAAEGSVTGDQYNSSAVQFDASDNSEQRKTVRLEARVRDAKGEGKADATVTVIKGAVVTAMRLPDIIFPERSARINNCGKRVLLEELKSFVERDPAGTVVLVGHIGSKEHRTANLDLQRALNAAAVISAGQGICGNFPATRISIAAVGAADNGAELRPQFCATSAITRSAERPGQVVKDTDEQARFRRLEVWFVPANGKLPSSASEYQSASVLPVAHLGCPK